MPKKNTKYQKDNKNVIEKWTQPQYLPNNWSYKHEKKEKISTTKNNKLTNKKTINKNAHIKNGKKKNGGKIYIYIYMNWNKGNSNAVNRITTIEQVLATHTPDILCIHEFNFRQNDERGLLQIKGYYLYTDSMLEEYGMSRTGIYVKNEIKTKRRQDLEVKGDSMIWISVYPYRKTKFNLCSGN